MKKFDITKEQKEEIMKRIQTFFLKERDEEIGDLASMIMLDFIMEEIAPLFYNIGVADSHAFITEKLEDLFGIEKYKTKRFSALRQGQGTVSLSPCDSGLR